MYVKYQAHILLVIIINLMILFFIRKFSSISFYTVYFLLPRAHLIKCFVILKCFKQYPEHTKYYLSVCKINNKNKLSYIGKNWRWGGIPEPVFLFYYCGKILTSYCQCSMKKIKDLESKRLGIPSTLIFSPTSNLFPELLDLILLLWKLSGVQPF